MSWSRVVVGIDGSESSQRALKWAANEAQEHGAELVVLTTFIVPAAPMTVGYLAMPAQSEQEWQADAKKKARQLVDDTLGAEPTVTVRVDAVEGLPAKMLIDASHDADLIVVGTRGHGGFAGMLLGSVSQHLTAHAACTVAVVR